MIGHLTKIIILLQVVGEIMSRFYRKPKPETMKKNRETYREAYKDEIAWMKVNISTIQKSNKFLYDMYMILITGSRKVTPKMESAIINGVHKCMNSPLYDEELREEADKKLKPILGKINVVLAMAESRNDKAIGFVQNVLEYVKNNHRITKKQMEALNKVHKRCSEDLFDEKEEK